MVAVFWGGGDPEWWGLLNSYAFSIPMVLLYAWPLVSPFSAAGWDARLHEATMNWIVWLSCFTAR